MSQFKYQQLTEEEIKLAEIEMLQEYSRFCREHDLHYSLIGGTLLGAVRHGGFIPWDDDIDVAMPRPDYDKFVSLADAVRAETGLIELGAFGCNMAVAPLCKLSNASVLVQPADEIDTRPLWIDVMPFDALPDSESATASLYRRVRILQCVLMAFVTKPGVGNSLYGRVFRTILRRFRRIDSLRNCIAARVSAFGREREYGSTGSVGVLTWGMYGSGERFPKSGLDEMAQVEFEGDTYTAMGCWDTYLTGIYGNYMQLPPIESRVNHGLLAWRIVCS